ncbi:MULTISPECIES: GNAT family N-acetyltransferase [unclassified Lactococcus]|uniref:GNAT family N-acetyltransferase n=1 Tax=unclassified Lactococcus TaxID=2643510 RepID=UPI0011C8A350|nr:GNAT family N-acetyltransferase [Lactococcus sp. dk101]TXK36938.1 N-acetyltransferase [Lactococcus sp. dk310]TXK45820.1 N-acetyltransferase [Lactococcus sp. dk322]
MVFSKNLDNLIVTRTFINPAFRGQGLAGLLMERAIEIAKHENLKISATCSYGVKYIENHKDELKNLL